MVEHIFDQSMNEHELLIKNCKSLKNEVKMASDMIVNTLKKGNKLLICGNGGSAADAQHFAGEIVGRFKLERKGWPAIALTTDTSVITAWSNDYSFETVFSRQVEALGKEGDLLISISTSGNSPNCIKANAKAKELKINIINLLGKDGGKMKNTGDINIIINSNNTPRIQEIHELFIHIICEIVEREMLK